MAVESAIKYLSKSTKVRDAFSVPLMLYIPPLRNTEDILAALKRGDKNIPKLGFDLYNAGIAYLAFHGQSAYIQAVGRILWDETERMEACLNGSISPADSAFLYGLMPKDAAKFRKANGFDDYPLVYSDVGLKKVTEGGDYICIEKKRSSIVFLPLLHFIIRANKSSIENLLQLVFIASKVRDTRNGRTEIESSKIIDDRAIAYQAHFLREVIKAEPKVQIPELYRATLELYPEGVFEKLDYSSVSERVKALPLAE